MRTILIIPTMNEERTIINVIKEARKYVDKIILVDSSTDNTRILVRKHFPDVRILHESKTGKGRAIKKGIHEAGKFKPEFIVFMDGDGERDPREIKNLISTLERHNADIVIGCRKKMRSLLRRFLNKFTIFWVNLALGCHFSDISSGFMAMRFERLLMLDLKAKNFDIELNIFLEAWSKGFKMVSIPVSVPTFAESKCKIIHMLEINDFFDRWVLNFDRKPWRMKIAVPFCLLGLLISSLVRIIYLKFFS